MRGYDRILASGLTVRTSNKRVAADVIATSANAVVSANFDTTYAT